MIYITRNWFFLGSDKNTALDLDYEVGHGVEVRSVRSFR